MPGQSRLRAPSLRCGVAYGPGSGTTGCQSSPKIPPSVTGLPINVSSSPDGVTVWIAPSAPMYAMSDPSGAHVGLCPTAIIAAFLPERVILQISRFGAAPRTKVSLLPPGPNLAERHAHRCSSGAEARCRWPYGKKFTPSRASSSLENQKVAARPVQVPLGLLSRIGHPLEMCAVAADDEDVRDESAVYEASLDKRDPASTRSPRRRIETLSPRADDEVTPCNKLKQAVGPVRGIRPGHDHWETSLAATATGSHFRTAPKLEALWGRIEPAQGPSWSAAPPQPASQSFSDTLGESAPWVTQVRIAKRVDDGANVVGGGVVNDNAIKSAKD